MDFDSIQVFDQGRIVKSGTHEELIRWRDMRVLILADSMDKIRAKSDTGLSLLREAIRRGHDTWLATAEDIELRGSQVWVTAQQVLSCVSGSLPKTKRGDILPLQNFDTVWIRKDPPFDATYLTVCWLLSLYEEKVLILNRPSVLLRHHEKLIPFQAVREGFIRENEIISTYLSLGLPKKAGKSITGKPVVSKPWFGFGGHGVARWPSYEKAVAGGSSSEHLMFQPYLSLVPKSGDRRVLFIEGEYVGDFVRMPQAGSIVCNLAQGGQPELRRLNSAEKALVKRLGKFLSAHDIFLAGADFLDGRLSEVNVTAPTGIETLINLGERNLAEEFVKRVERIKTSKKSIPRVP